MKNFKTILYNCYLCLRFPFLYPRNRFTDRHRVNALGSILYRLRQESIQNISITGKLEKDTSVIFSPIERFCNNIVKLDKENKKLIISNNTDKKEYDLKRLLWNDDRFNILGISVIFALTGNPIINVHVIPKDLTDKTNYGFSYGSVELVTNKWKHFWYKVFSWIDEQILDRILFIPTYTELDSMPEGWRKAFGIQMCKEIKSAILKSGGRKYLRKYRIMQIKEKFAQLCWYDSGQTPEVKQVVEKYEGLSYYTCIDCGKPATKMTGGWICPYCDDCFPKDHFIYMERNNGSWKMTKEWKNMKRN